MSKGIFLKYFNLQLTFFPQKSDVFFQKSLNGSWLILEEEKES